MDLSAFESKFKMLRFFNSKFETPFVNLMINVFIHFMFICFKKFFMGENSLVLFY